MSELPNISEEYHYFEKLFNNAEKEQIGDLYKKELYIMKEDLDSNKYKTTLKLMHDTLLQKFMCEEFTEFVPKNEVAQLIYPPEKKEANNNNNKSSQKEDAADKELLEEYEYLKELYRLNYLTFSPFALEYFEKINEPKKQNIEKTEKDSNNNSSNNNDNNITNNENNNINNDNNNNINISNNGKVYNMNNKKEEKSEEQIEKEEKDAKLLKILNFDYNCFELNNDLLFNISQGFIDISKLKENNLKYSDKNQNKDNSDSYDSSKNDEFDVYEYDEELNQELIDKTMKFVKLFEKNLILKRAIVRFKDELSRLPQKCKNKIKNEFYKYWDAEFTKLEKDNERLIKRREEEERKQKLLKQKMYLDRLKREKENEEERKLNEEKEFINKLRKIQNDAKVKSGVKETKNKERKILKRKKKNYNKSASPVRKEIIKTNKKYYCSGFNLYKEILSNRQKNGSAKH